MKTKSLICLLGMIAANNGFATNYKEFNIDVYGNTNYSSDSAQSLKTNLYIEYNYSLYEPKHKKWGLFVAGKVNPMYDHLGQELKVDVFTVVGIDF